MYMSDQPTARTKNPYEIRERTFLFACDVTRAMLKLHAKAPRGHHSRGAWDLVLGFGF
jgi:hypothetical protein